MNITVHRYNRFYVLLHFTTVSVLLFSVTDEVINVLIAGGHPLPLVLVPSSLFLLEHPENLMIVNRS